MWTGYPARRVRFSDLLPFLDLKLRPTSRAEQDPRRNAATIEVRIETERMVLMLDKKIKSPPSHSARTLTPGFPRFAFSYLIGEIERTADNNSSIIDRKHGVACLSSQIDAG